MDVLQSFVTVLEASRPTSGTSRQQSVAQSILQPFSRNFRLLSTQPRSALMHLALSVLGDSACTACVSVMISHVYATYESDDASKPTSGGEADTSLILLSRAAQRKAGRIMRSSLPEEMLRLASTNSYSQTSRTGRYKV